MKIPETKESITTVKAPIGWALSSFLARDVAAMSSAERVAVPSDR